MTLYVLYDEILKLLDSQTKAFFWKSKLQICEYGEHNFKINKGCGFFVRVAESPQLPFLNEILKNCTFMTIRK